MQCPAKVAHRIRAQVEVRSKKVGVHGFCACVCVKECECVFEEGRSKGVRHLSDRGAQKCPREELVFIHRLSPHRPLGNTQTLLHTQMQTVGPHVIVNTGVQCQHSRKKQNKTKKTQW